MAVLNKGASINPGVVKSFKDNVMKVNKEKNEVRGRE